MTRLRIKFCVFLHCSVDLQIAMLMQMSGLYLNVPVLIVDFSPWLFTTQRSDFIRCRWILPRSNLQQTGSVACMTQRNLTLQVTACKFKAAH